MSSDLQERLQLALGDAYRLERELARGGMSRLFLATEASLNRQVMVKHQDSIVHLLFRSTVRERVLKLTGLLVLVLASSGPIAAQTTSDEKQLRRLEDNWCLALKTRNAALLNEILAQDYVEVTSSGTIESRAEAIAAIEDPQSATTSCGNSNVKVRVFGNAAVVTGVMEQAGTTNGVAFGGKRLVFTDTYVRRGGRWQCVAGQSTAMTVPR